MRFLLFTSLLAAIYLISMAVLVRRTACPGSRLPSFIVAAISPILVMVAIVLSLVSSPAPQPVPARLEEVEAEIAARKAKLFGSASRPGLLIATAWRLRYERFLSQSAGRIYEDITKLRTVIS